ncbi:MAG: hypothetical protein QMC48_07825 [SAR324 cluster bacterium]|jgi:hypothetical protein|tara:strand:+ start:108 stop:920 length:813 start_codon:yes stop_codon:yes gene_type:complete
MTEISHLKYIQWRPIGVCDTGTGKERKAKMFSRFDLASVTGPEVKRENWREQPKVMELIQLYARDVADLSTLTNGMHAPEIDQIKLVGAVIGHNQTPNLNLESADGKVQFFQVSFKEGQTKKSSRKWTKWLKWISISMTAFLVLILMILLINRFSLLSLKNKEQSASVCSSNRQNVAYTVELAKIRKSLLDELSRLPAWLTFKEARVHCTGGRMLLKQHEQRLLQCLLTVRNRTKNISVSSRPDLNQIEACAINLCRRKLPHLTSSCKRL